MAKASSHPTAKRSPPKTRRTNNRTSPRKLARKLKVEKALELRLAGHSWDEVARKSGYANRAAAYNAVTEEMANRAALMAENTDQLRHYELDRLDRYSAKLDPKVKKGDPKAIQVALRIQERRSRLLGLDAPTKTEIAGPDGGPIELRQMADEDLRAQLQAALEGMQK